MFVEQNLPNYLRVSAEEGKLSQSVLWDMGLPIAVDVCLGQCKILWVECHIINFRGITKQQQDVCLFC